MLLGLTSLLSPLPKSVLAGIVSRLNLHIVLNYFFKLVYRFSAHLFYVPNIVPEINFLVSYSDHFCGSQVTFEAIQRMCETVVIE